MKSRLARVFIVLLSASLLSGAVLVQNARAQNTLNIYLFSPATGNPGQTVGIELWTLFDNSTSGRPDLAFNATGETATSCTVFPCLTFLVKINLGISVPPHVHTPGGSLIVLSPFKEWVHPGAWNTSYTVPSELGLYGVHMYANYTVKTGVNAFTSYVSQAQTTFTATNAPITQNDIANGVSGLATMTMSFGILGLVVVAIILDVVILVWKKNPTKA